MKTPILISILISFLILTNSTYAQKKQGKALIDSLLTQLPNVKEDTTKVNMLTKIGYTYYTINPDEGLKYATQGLALAEKLNWRKGISVGYLSKGINYYAKSEYSEALDNTFKSLKLAEELGDKPLQASPLNNIGLIYEDQSEYPKALEYFTKALAINSTYGYKFPAAGNLTNIGIIYSIQSNYPKALENHQKAYKMYEQLGSKFGTAANLSNIGVVYHNQGDYPNALENYFKALKIYEQMGAKQQIAINYGSIANLYGDQKDYPKSLEYSQKALQLFEEVGNTQGVSGTLSNIGNVYLNQSDYPKALEYFTKALAINEETGNKTWEATNLLNIGKIYHQKSDYAKAIAYAFKSLNINQELNLSSEIAENFAFISEIYLSIANSNQEIPLNPYLTGTKIDYLKQAKIYTDSAIVIQKEVGDLNNLSVHYKLLSQIETLLGNQESALESYKKYAIFKDSVFNIEKDKKLTQTALKYEFSKREDSLKLETEKREIGLQKEMALKSLSYEYEKKRQAAKTEEEKQKLLYEEKLKQQEIENTYAQKIAAAEALQKQKELEGQKKELERKQKEELAKTEQEKKDIRQRNIRNSILVGLGATLLFLGVVYRQRNRIAKEKHRSEELLLNILPAETAEELKATGAAQAKNFSEVTVLFTDFKNFTTMSEHLSAQELVNEINYYYSAFDTIISKHHIEKIKTIGDAYMCAGGLPTANKTHAEDTVRAALEIRDFMNAERQKRQAQGKPFLEIRIGCNTGPVIAGIVGIKKFAYDIWGDTVNTAARMESSGEVGKVNISGSTYELVKNKFTCTHRGKIQAKNKGEIDMYFVEA